MDETDRQVVDPLQVVDREQHGTRRRERTVRPLEDTEWVARLLSSASEHQPTEIPAGSRDLHELAEQGPGGRKRDELDGLESDNATQLSDLGAIKDLGEEATLAAPGLARDKGGRRRPLPTRAVYQLGQLIELLSTADERRAHGTSLQQPQAPFGAAADASRIGRVTGRPDRTQRLPRATVGPHVTTLSPRDFTQLHVSIGGSSGANLDLTRALASATAGPGYLSRRAAIAKARK
jgi:hypothetical protein